LYDRSIKNPDIKWQNREAGVIMYTAGSSLLFPDSLFDPVRALPYHLYILVSEGISGYCSAIVLLVMILMINLTAMSMAVKNSPFTIDMQIGVHPLIPDR
jgi:hypothetical protein